MVDHLVSYFRQKHVTSNTNPRWEDLSSIKRRPLLLIIIIIIFIFLLLWCLNIFFCTPLMCCRNIQRDLQIYFYSCLDRSTYPTNTLIFLTISKLNNFALLVKTIWSLPEPSTVEKIDLMGACLLTQIWLV